MYTLFIKLWISNIGSAIQPILPVTLRRIHSVYLMLMPGEVKDPIQGRYVTCSGLYLEKDNSEIRAQLYFGLMHVDNERDKLIISRRV